jgi:hypothetical protein
MPLASEASLLKVAASNDDYHQIICGKKDSYQLVFLILKNTLLYQKKTCQYSSPSNYNFRINMALKEKFTSFIVL